MGPNFYIGNHRGAPGTYVPLRPSRGDPMYEANDARALAEADLKRPLDPNEVSRYWMARSWSEIEQAPAAWLRLLGWKWFLAWNAVETVDTDGVQTHARYSPVLRILGGVLHFGVLCPLAVLGAWWTRRDWRRLWVLYALALVYAAGVAAFYVFGRYRFPIVPTVVLFAAAALVELWDRLILKVGDPRRELGSGLLIVVLAAIFCNWQFDRYDEDAITYQSAAMALLDQNRPADALTLLRKAEQSDSRIGEIHNEIAQLLLKKRSLAEARRYQEKAVALAPNNATFLFNLSTIEALLGKPDAARAALQQAIALDPLNAPAYVQTGILALQAGDTAAAITSLRHGLTIEPERADAHLWLGLAFAKNHQYAAAIQSLQDALDRDNRLLPAASRLAWLLATVPDDQLRNGARALQLAEHANQASQFRNPEHLDALAAAYAETGQFERAVETCDKAVELARRMQNEALARLLASRRAIYQARQPFRESTGHEPVAQ
jgi:tetratricopeptide (TPR) repeat protein